MCHDRVRGSGVRGDCVVYRSMRGVVAEVMNEHH
jgi:hypothetical protein